MMNRKGTSTESDPIVDIDDVFDGLRGQYGGSLHLAEHIAGRRACIDKSMTL